MWIADVRSKEVIRELKTLSQEEETTSGETSTQD